MKMSILTAVDFDTNKDIPSIILGDGSIAVTDISGAKDIDGNLHSGVALKKLETPVCAGDIINGVEEWSSVDDYSPDFMLMFTKVDSIDVVINALKRAKVRMLDVNQATGSAKEQP
jgi:hypothetical protein